MQKKYFWLVAILLLSTINFYFLNASFRQAPGSNINIPNERFEEEETKYGNVVNNILIDSSNYLANIQNIGVLDITGRITCISIDESDSNHILAGGDFGGLWISHDRGSNWQPVNDFAPTLRTTSLAQNHFQHNEYYYSTGVNKINNGTLLHDIYRSNDGGTTFSQVTPTTNPAIGTINKIICSPVDANTIYFFQEFGANNTLGALYRTTDKFNTFQKVFQVSDANIHDFIVIPNGEVIVTATGGNRVWSSATGDPGSYSLSNTGIVAGVSDVRVAFCKTQPLIRYATGHFANGKVGVHKTLNGGTTWTFLDTLNIYSNAGRSILAVKPDNPDIIFVGGVGMYGSIDGGAIWRQANAGWDFQQIIFDPNRAGIAFFASDSGIRSLELSQATGSSFGVAKKYDHTLVVQDISHGDFSINGNMTITGLWDIHTHVTRNNNTSIAVNVGDGMYSYCSKQDSNIAYGSYQGGVMFRMNNILTNNGSVYILNQMDANNNHTIDEGAVFLHPYVMNNADDKQLYFPTLKRLWRTADKGDNWIPVSNFYGNPFNRLAITASNKINPIVYWTNYDSIFVLPNAATAAPLSEFGMPVPEDPLRIIVDVNNDSCLYLLKDRLPAKILHSSNMLSGNVQWTNISGNFPVDVTPLCITAYPGNSEVILVGSNEGGIYITINGGQTWTREKEFPNVRIAEIKVRESDKNIFIFTHGRGVWSAKLQPPVIPLTLLSFSATANDADRTASLTWNTAEEINTKLFDVERSVDGRIFSSVANVNAYGQGSHFYQSNIRMTVPIEYYRLKMIDIDGRFTYSNIVKVKLSKAVEGFSILNNPVKNLLIIDVNDMGLVNTDAVIVDNNGRQVYHFKFREGRQNVTVEKLSAGIYYLRTITGAKKMLLIK